MPNTVATREFKTQGGCLMQAFSGCFLAIFGVVLLVFFWPLGLLLLLAACGAPFLVGYLLKSTTITVGPQGFSVATRSQKDGSRYADYRWEEVSRTEYDEDTFRSAQGGHRTTRSFTVETVRGVAFRQDSGIKGFDDLIQVFNQRTPQLPYTWERQAGFNVSAGPVTVGREGYRRVPRGQAATMPPTHYGTP